LSYSFLYYGSNYHLLKFFRIIPKIGFGT